MPLLNKQTFTPEPVPSDIRLDEEVFVCQATKEVFRDYEKFFNRHFLCNSLVWTCELTGATNLTYTQALESEKEANKFVNSLPECYQKASLSLVHHTKRTNVKTLSEEICAFYRERYIVGEQLDFTQTTPSGAKIVNHVRALKVVPPPKPVMSPVRVPVISMPTMRSPSFKSPPPLIPIFSPSITIPPVEGDAQPNGLRDGVSSPQVPNGLPSNDITSQDLNVPSARIKSPKTPRTPLPPLSAEINLNPADYKYIIELVDNPETKLQVSPKQLSRPKNVFIPKKLKLFLRNALHRPSEKYPFFVKEEYIQKFSLGASTISLEPLPTPTSRSRKRTLSQASLEMFFSPGSAPEAKKSRPLSLDTSSSRKKPKKRKTPSKGSKSKKEPKVKSPSKKSPTKALKTPKSPGKTPRSKVEALKVLNKAKKFKQMDLKKTVVRSETKLPLSEEEVIQLRQRAEEERRLKAALIAAEKLRKKELYRLEKLRQQELMKPREDLLCEDSKDLPDPTAVRTELPMELFGDAVMVLEFLHTFGPLFNLKEAIPAGINFEKIEYAVVSSDTESLLYEIVKFLLQALFAIMEEEKENRVEIYMSDKIEGMESDSQDAKSSKEVTEGLESEEVIVPVEMETDDRPLEQVDLDEKPLDIRIESLKVSATMIAKWPYLTQKALINELVLDPFTVTEVLRLHLLSSGGYAEHVSRKLFRTYNRGYYTDADEPALALRLRRPDLFDTLSQTSLYDLSPADKLEILSTLCSQLLTYSVSREHMEEAASRAKKARRTIREKKAMHKKQEKDIQLQNTLSKQKQKEEAIATTSGESVPIAENITDKQDGTAVPAPLASKHPSPPPRRSSKDNERPGVSETEDHSKPTEPAEEITEEGRKERMDKELGELNKEITEASSVVNLRPIGSDRHHRRYWIFPSLPGLYVEDSGYFPTDVQSRGKEAEPMEVDVKRKQDHPCIAPPPQLKTRVSIPMSAMHAQVQLPRVASETTPHSALPIIDLTLGSPVKHQRDVPDLISILQTANLVALEQENKPLPRPKQPSDPPHEVPAQSSRLSWTCYTTAEDVDNLISSLNPRGVREIELKNALENHKSLLLKTLSKCPFLPSCSRSPYGPRKYNSARQYLELYLREQILDLEEKLYIGNLGYIKNVESREKWRDSIESSGAAADVGVTTDENDGRTLEVPPSGHSRSVSPAPEAENSFKLKSGNVTPVMDPSVRELSKALLQVHSGIEKKYLMPPLGTAIDEKNKKPKRGKKNGLVKESELCVDQWRASLARSTNLSQIFLHMATLERAVMWSKSLMNLRCRICRKKTGDEYLLLCDGCDYGYHTFCLRPPLTSIPDGDWFCYNCNPITPVKPKRQAKRVVVVDQEEESSESESEEEPEESGGSDEDNGNRKSDDADAESEDEEEVVITKRSLRSRGRSAEVSSHGRRSARVVGQKKTKSLDKKGSKKVMFTSEKSEGGKNKTPEVSGAYEGTKARKKLQLDNVPPPIHHSKAESVIASIIDLKCSRNAKHLTSAGKREQKGLEVQLCEALWSEVNDHDDSWYFATPVKKKDYPTYLEVISEPMDLRTIRSKIKCGKYSGIDEFLSDMDLIFSNCQTFHKRLSEIGRAGTALKKFFEKRCSDLGLRDLLCERREGRTTSGLGLRSSRRRKS